MNKMDLTQRLENCYSGAVLCDMGIGFEGRSLTTSSQIFGSRGDCFRTCIHGPGSSRHFPHGRRKPFTLDRTLGQGYGTGHVVVCQPQDDDRALMGELSAETLQFRGVRGYVVDGGCRDVSFIRHMKFPVFCRFTTPRDIVAAWTPEEYEVPITIGDITIQSGDFILGDQDGVVVLPRIHAESIVNRVEEVMQTENLVPKAILDGVHPQEAYLRHRKF